ncbi:MAG: hypothetical protein QNK29_14045, partial [Desulfobacterales bacterium]|nr:hypothetical protein [Desulfobacterales bacterium]MDX2513105.1 hypothetical protein [Desulfobacterales bacterium]
CGDLHDWFSHVFNLNRNSERIPRSLLRSMRSTVARQNVPRSLLRGSSIPPPCFPEQLLDPKF